MKQMDPFIGAALNLLNLNHKEDNINRYRNIDKQIVYKQITMNRRIAYENNLLFIIIFFFFRVVRTIVLSSIRPKPSQQNPYLLRGITSKQKRMAGLSIGHLHRNYLLGSPTITSLPQLITPPARSNHPKQSNPRRSSWIVSINIRLESLQF